MESFLTHFEKASRKYISRKKGKNGKWIYDYGKKKTGGNASDKIDNKKQVKFLKNAISKLLEPSENFRYGNPYGLRAKNKGVSMVLVPDGENHFKLYQGKEGYENQYISKYSLGEVPKMKWGLYKEGKKIDSL